MIPLKHDSFNYLLYRKFLVIFSSNTKKKLYISDSNPIAYVHSFFST